MKKEKLLEMAREAGLLFNEDIGSEFAHNKNKDKLFLFANEILELAAQECEKKAGPNVPSYFEINEYIDEAAQAIRNLKEPNK